MRLFAGLLAIIGVVVMLVEGGNVLHGLRSQSWRPVPARITWVKFDVSPGYKKDNFYFWLRYRYEVGGHDYDSERIQFGTIGISSRKELQAWQERFPRGEEVTAYVDPVSPQESTLIPGVDATRYAAVFLIGPLMSAGGLSLLRFFGQWNSPG